VTQYRILLRPEVRQQLIALARAAQTQPGGLRDREFRALKLGLQALKSGREESFKGKQLGYSPVHHDLRDCAEIKLPVVEETRHGQELGPSHRLVYREFEPDDGGLPFREVICFEHRKDNRPFNVAGIRLARETGVRLRTLQGVPETRPDRRPRPPDQAAPVRQQLSPDLQAALAAASGPVPARGAVSTPVARASAAASHRGSPPDPERQR
jgi:hypothetical protein